jgi:hypothetical protein
VLQVLPIPRSAIAVALTVAGALSVCLVFVEVARAGLVPESEPNEPLLAAQNVDAFFTLAFDPNIENSVGINISQLIPHVEIASTGDGTVTTDFYSFSVAPGDAIILDIDCGELSDVSCFSLVSVDSWIILYDPSGAPFAFNDDGNLQIDSGTPGTYDSFLELTPPAPGLWTIEVTEYPGGVGILAGGDYILNVSVGPPLQISDCCFDNGSPGCDDSSCESTVCALDPICCSFPWGNRCANHAKTDCGGLCTIPEPRAMLQVVSGLVGLVLLHSHRRRRSRKSRPARHGRSS